MGNEREREKVALSSLHTFNFISSLKDLSYFYLRDALETTHSKHAYNIKVLL